MKLLNKLERKFGRYAIKNLMMYIVALNVVVYLLNYLYGAGIMTSKLMLIPSLVMKGEVWRLITYIFIPPNRSVLWILFTLYFYYIVGAGIEREWGSFKFNVYYLIGILGTTLAAFISGTGASALYLNMSLFLAFAYIYPNYEMLLFFILPMKMKYLAWLDMAFLGITFIGGDISIKLSIVAAIANYLIFFGKDTIQLLKNNKNAFSNKRKYTSQIPKKDHFHKCTVCGITEKEDKKMEFRYCSNCDGHYEYCMEHLKQHEHIKKDNVIRGIKF